MYINSECEEDKLISRGDVSTTTSKKKKKKKYSNVIQTQLQNMLRTWFKTQQTEHKKLKFTCFHRSKKFYGQMLSGKESLET